MSNPFLLRVFDPETDYEKLCEWWRARGKEPPALALMPKLGVVAHRGGEDCAMAFLYMDNSSPVCFLELPISRPELPLADARGAFEAAVGFLKMRAAQLGYLVMYAYTFAALAREARKLGFKKQREGMIMIYAELKGGV